MSEQKALEVLEQKFQLNEESVNRLVVKTDEDLTEVANQIKIVKDFGKYAEAELGKIIDPLKQVVKEQTEKFRPYLESAKKFEMLLKQKAGKYMEEKEAKRLAAEKKIAADLESGKIKKEETAVKRLEALPEQKISIKTETAGLQMRKIKDIEITDRNLIPDEYWVVDEVKLKKVALAGVAIPGVKIIEKTSMVSK